MASKIILKKSSVASKVPLVGDLEYGELALNYTDGKLYYKNYLNSIFPVTPFTQKSGVYNWDYTNKRFFVGTQESSPSGVFFKPDGLVMYVCGFTTDTIKQYSLSVAWDISTATYVGTSVTIANNYVADAFFKPDGLKVFVSNANNGTIYEYTLTTAWDITSLSLAQSKVLAEDVTITGLYFTSDGLKLFTAGNTNDSIYSYTLSSAWNISTATLVTSKSIADRSTFIEGLDFSADGLTLYVCSLYYIHQYNLTVAWDLSTAVFYGEVYLRWYDSDNQAVRYNASQNKAWIVGSSANYVYEYSTAGTNTNIDTTRTYVTGNVELNKNAKITEDLIVGGLVYSGSATVNGALTVSSIASNINIGTSQTTGTTLIGNTAQTGVIAIGRSTVSQALNLHAGATASGSTKTINLGVNGLSGSTTNIEIGSTVSGALGNININSPTTAITATTTSTTTTTGALKVAGGVGILENLNVGGTINKLTLTTPATGATLTISDAKTISFPQSLTFPSTNGTNTYVLSTNGSGVLSWVAPGAGTGDMTKAVYDTTNNGKVDLAEAAESVPWSGITSIPSTFTPSTHTHVIADVTGLQTALDGKQATLVSATNIKTINGTSILGSGDLVVSGGSSPTTGTATIDFGAHPGTNEATVTVTGQTAILSTSIVALTVRSDATSLDHTANDHSYFLTFAALAADTPTAGTGFTIKARSHQKLTGKWTLNWSWI